MTTVVYRDGVMAADTGVCTTNGATTYHGTTVKIKKLYNGTVIGAAGGLAKISLFFNMLDDPEYDFDAALKQFAIDDFTAIVVNRKGKIRYLDGPIPIALSSKYSAIGSGREFAVGALEMGADAVQAVKIAAKYDRNTILPLDAMNVRTGEMIRYRA